MIEIRSAQPTDAEDMAEVQNAIYRAGLRSAPVDVALVRERYLDVEHTVACTVADQDGRVVGFQSLKRAWPGNPYDVPEGGESSAPTSTLTLADVDWAAASSPPRWQRPEPPD